MSSMSSTSVFHASHVGHRPVHWGEVAPQSVQRWTVRSLAMHPTLKRGCDAYVDRRRPATMSTMATTKATAPTTRSAIVVVL